MKQIKTVVGEVKFSELFDKEVNDALLEGWKITRRDLFVAHVNGKSTLLYAELEKDMLTDVDACCENCKYYDLSNDEEPCGSCSEDADKWEPSAEYIASLLKGKEREAEK